MANIADLVRRSAAARPQHPALVTTAREITWADLDGRVDKAAHAMVAAGLGPGSRVALMIGNRPEFAVAYFAVLRAGLVAVPFNPAYTASEVVQRCRDADAALLLHDPRDCRIGPSIAKRASGTRVVAVDSELGASLVGAGPGGGQRFPSRRTPGGDLAVLVYTAGSEGQPKGVMLSHGALRANIDDLARLRKPAALEASDRLLLSVPVFHTYGLNAGLGLVAKRGATCVLLERFDPRASLRAIRELGVTTVFAAPPMYVAWSAADSLREAMADVRLLVSGAQTLPPEVFAQFRTVTGKPIWEGYGLTECCPVVTTTLACARPRPGSVGQPLAGVELSLRDATGVEVLEGDPGEVWVRAQSLLTGYWPDGRGGPDPDGWFHTGDVALVDEEGDYQLVDRRRDLIAVSGFNVYPREVEAVLASHPAVADVAVVGVAHPLTGEAVKAVVVVEPEAVAADDLLDRLPADLRVHCEARLARFKCPTIIEFAAALPRAVTGRVTRQELKEPTR